MAEITCPCCRQPTRDFWIRQHMIWSARATVVDATELVKRTPVANVTKYEAALAALERARSRLTELECT